MKKPVLITLAVVAIGAGLVCHSWQRTGATPAPDRVKPAAAAAGRISGGELPIPANAAQPDLAVETQAAEPIAGEPQRLPDMAKIAAFRDWTERWAATNEKGREELREEGVELARERREEFKALIVTDPARALGEAVPRVIRQDLPADIVAQLEAPVATTGEYIKFLGTPAPDRPRPEEKLAFQTFETAAGEKYKAYVFGEMEPVMWKKNMPLQGIAVDNELAVAENPVRRLEVGERIPAGTIVEETCPVSGTTTTAPATGEAVTADSPTVQIAERVITLCNGSHVTVLEDQNRTKLQASGPGGANVFVDNFPGTASRAIGNFRCLYMRVVYPDQLWAPNTEDSAWWDLANTTRFFLDSSYGKMTTTATVTPLLTLPYSKAWYYAKNGQYDSLGLIHSDAVTQARILGYDPNQFDCLIVRVAGGPKLDGASWGGGNRVWLSWDGMDVMNHECGHSLGLGHANSWVSTDGTPSGSGYSGEYGNPFDVMGGGYGFGAQYNTNAKRALGWLPDNYVHQPSVNGTYRIYAYDQPRLEEGKQYQLSVPKNAGSRFSLEYHPASGHTNSVLGLYNGNIMAMMPGEWGLQVGRTFTDFEADLHFTVLSKNDTTPASLDIVYNRGPFPGNQPPAVSLAASATSISPGASVTFTATATDPNGDPLAYYWQFDDGGAGANSAEFTRAFANSGQFNAMVTVSDMKGGITRRHVVINVGSHSLQTVTGNIAWNGQPLQNVRVACGGKYGYTDADGNYALAGIGTGSQTLAAALNGYTFTPLFTNPLAVVAGSNTANWTAGDSVNSLSVTKISDATEGGAPGLIRLTRSGDTSADLVVHLTAAAGSATKGTDYTFSPDYEPSGGLGVYTMGIGQTTLDVAVAAVDDTLTEGPETVEMQVVSNGTYLSHSPNSVVLNITDNETSLPVIAVAASDAAAAESPADSASFTFTRSGSTAAALGVPVAWAGTASYGVDYAALPATVTFPVGQSSTTVTVDPLNDNLGEASEDIVAAIAPRPNNWVRLVRSGSVITGYRSPDGSAWTQVGSPMTVSMSSPCLVGLAVNAHNNTLATATFDNVSISPGVAALTGADIGSVGYSGSTYLSNGVYTIQGSGPDIYGTADGFHFASAPLTGDCDIRARVSSVTGSDPWAKVGVMIRETSAAGSKNVLMCVGGSYDFQYRTATDGASAWVDGGALNTAIPYVINASAKTATATLTDNDPLLAVSVSIPDASAAEQGADSAVFLISRTGSTAAPLKVYYGLAGTALHGTDYQPLSGEVIIPAGARSAPVVITPVDDDLGEPESESVYLSLTTFNGAYSLGPIYSGAVYIHDNEDVPLVSVRPGGFGVEGGGNPIVVFRSIGSATGTVTVNYTVSGTATAGVDYTALSGTVTVPANGTNDVTVTIPVINDSTPEAAETVVVKITPGAGYRVYNDGTATTGISDNDSGGERVRVSKWAENASEAGAVGRFYIARSVSTAADLTVNYTMSGTATNGADYNLLSGSVVIPAGQWGVDVTATPINDTAAEGTETITLTVAPGSGYGPDEPSTALHYLFDNETPAVTLAFASAAQATTEQAGANGQYRDITVNLSAPSADTVTAEYFSQGGSATGDDVDWALVDASAGNAVIPRGVLTFPPGSTSQMIRVRVNNDGVSEGPETAMIAFANARFAAVGANVHTLTITDGVTIPYTVRLAMAATARAENAGTEPLLMAMLDRPCGATPVTVDYTLGGSATAGSDYLLSPGTLTFTAGEQVKLLPLTILQDGSAESAETIVVTLTNPGNAQLGSPASHTITLTDDNPEGSSVWINPTGGAWSDGDNWSYGMIANGVDRSADFSTLDIAGDVTVSLNSARTLGSLVFADAAPSGRWILNGSGGALTLDVSTGTPGIAVNNQSATIGLPIAGTDGLRKTGPGTLVLAATNTYSGETEVASNGIGNANYPQLTLGNPAGRAILGDLRIGSGGTGTTLVHTTAANQFSASQTIQFNTNATEGGNWNYFNLLGNNQTVAGLNDAAGTGGVVEAMESETVHNTATLTLAGSDTYSFSGYMRNKAGGAGTGLLSLVKSGSGTQSLSGTRITYTGDTTVNQGTLAYRYADGDWTLTSVNKTIAAGGTMKVDLTPQTTQYRKTNLQNTAIDAGGVLELYGTTDNINSHYLINAWTATGAGTIQVKGGGSISNWTTTNSLSGFTGLLDIQNGRFAVNVPSNSTLGGTLDVNVAASGKLDLRSGHFAIDALDGAAGSVIHKSFTGDTVNLSVGNANGSSTFAGTMSGTNYSVTKNGTGTLTLTGNNTYTGSTTVTGGTLNATGTLGGAVTVQSAATLSVGTGAIGTLGLSNTLTLAGTTTMELGKSGAVLSADRVNGITSVTYGGALAVTNIGPDALVAGNTFTLFSATNYTGNFSSLTLPSLGAGLYWNTTQLVVNGTISVASTLANDPDGDGFSDYLEASLGTNPGDAASHPPYVYSGLRAWWRLNESSGTVADDATGLPQDGTLLNSPVWGSGLSGNAVTLNGTNQSVQTPPLTLNSNYGTITGWVKRNGAQVTWAGLFFERGASASGLSLYANHELRYHWNTAANTFNFGSGLIVPDNTWTFCAMVVQPNKGTLYMQPVGGAMQTVVNNVAHGTAAFGGNLYLGQDVAGGRFFKGGIDDVRVYSRALSSDEIVQVFEEAHPPHAPVFASNPVVKPAGQEAVAYTGQTLAGNASDVDPGDALTFTKVSGPAWLSIAANGALSGTPGSADAGANSFSVKVTDSTGLFATATLNIAIGYLNDSPVWTSNPVTGAGATEDAAYSNTLSSAVTDPDVAAGDVLTYAKLSGPAWLNVAANGALTGTPGNSQVGANAFSVRVTDTAGSSATATLNISVTNVNDAPTWTSATLTKPVARETEAYSGSLASDASDIDAGDTLTFTKMAGPAWLAIASNGALSGSPALGDVGDNSFTVRVADALGVTANATVQITVVPLNADGIWTKVTGGTWADPGNWSGSAIANGVGKTADFSTLNLTSHATVTLDGSRTLGNLSFGDTSPNRNWTVTTGSGGSLTLEVASGVPAITVNNQTTTLALTLAGTEGLAKAGAGTLILSGANTYAGDTLVNVGVLGLEHSGAGYSIPGSISAGNLNSPDIYATQDNQFAPGAAMTFTGNTGDHVRFELLGTTQTLAGVDNTGCAGHGVIQHREMVTAAAVDSLSQLVIDGASGSYYFDGYLRDLSGGTVGLTKSGASTQTLAGGNISYTGNTTVNGGTLVFTPADWDWTLTSVNKTIASGGTLKVNLSPQTTQYRKTNLQSTVIDAGGVLELYGTADNVNGHHLINAWTATGAGTIRVTGGGSVAAWTGTSNSLSGFTGLLDIQNGRFASNISSGSTLGGSLDVNVAATGKLDLRSGHFTIDALDGAAGSVVHKSYTGDTVNFTIGNGNGSGSFAGVMQNTNYNLIKAGTGTQALGGANTYTGTTTVNGGALLINGSLANSTTTVAAAGTLGGSGTLAGAVTNNGTLAPGNAAVGNLTINNALTLAGGSKLAWQIGNWTGAAGTGWDKLTVNSLNITATSGSPVTIKPAELSLANFTEANATFLLVQTSSGITGFAANKFSIDTSGLATPLGTWAVQQSGNNLLLAYTAYAGGATPPDNNGNGILDNWESARFGNANAGANLPEADPDRDGLSNLLEYALGTHPLQANANPLTYDLELLGDGKHLRLTVPKNPAATNLTYTVETCSEVNDWSAVNTTVESNTATELIVRDNATQGSAPRRFIRLNVTAANP